MHIYNDKIGSPYVYEITDDEQINVLFVGENVAECQRFIDGAGKRRRARRRLPTVR